VVSIKEESWQAGKVILHDRCWSECSWRSKRILQIPEYPDMREVEDVQKRLIKLPPVVSAGEVFMLEQALGNVCRGEAFVLQGGDCAERFDRVSAGLTKDIFHLFMQMAIILSYGLRKPVVKIGRIAGQFAKPRSSDIEKQGEVELPSYRGDMINDLDFTKEARTPSPSRMMDAYLYSVSTLNLLRSFVSGGYADVHRFLKNDGDHYLLCNNQNNDVELVDRYRTLLSKIRESIVFSESLGFFSDRLEYRRIDFYTSHEVLHLPYEECFVRRDTITGKGAVIAGSAHMLWIGDRTRNIDGAHVEFCRGIANPIGIKCGGSLTPDELLQLLDILNPGNIQGRITLITRFGSKNVNDKLATLIKAVKSAGRHVVWLCDPMHGNTITAANGMKTRDFREILHELREVINIHAQEGTFLGGVHLEMTSDSVTECIGGAHGVMEEHLGDFYRTACDPRLNAYQAVELMLRIVEDALEV